MSKKPFKSCATRNDLEVKRKAIIAWLGKDYVLHPEYVFREKHRLIVEAK